MTAECYNCGTTIEDDDLTYRVLYGRLEDAGVGNISEKLAGRAGEELDPGARERYWCFDCHKQERQADRAGTTATRTPPRSGTSWRRRTGRSLRTRRPSPSAAAAGSALSMV